MGDTSISIVPQNVNRKQAKKLSDKVVAYLIERKIISPYKSDCVLGEESGYPPGTKYKEALEESNNHFLELRTNGLQIVDNRQVFYANGVDEIKCPNCGTNNIESEWGEALDEWVNNTGNDKIKCLGCGHSFSIEEYIFEPAWAFGELGFTFWNWYGVFKESFLKDIEAVIGCKLKIVHSKL
jgi:ribosomal protein S27E